MKNYNKVNQIIERLYIQAIRKNDRVHEGNRKNISKFFNHIRTYWMVYWFLITKIFAIAMLGVGIHCLVARLNMVLPFGIVSDDMALWFIWGYSGCFIGLFIIALGILILFEHTIKKWQKNW